MFLQNFLELFPLKNQISNLFFKHTVPPPPPPFLTSKPKDIFFREFPADVPWKIRGLDF